MPQKPKFLSNTINQGDGLELLKSLPPNSTSLVFFDPQYEKVQNVLKRNYPLIFQTDQQISQFCQEIARVLKPSGFCLLWVNKAILINKRTLIWLLPASNLKIVDLLVWDKENFGFGTYFRNQAEFAFLLQKQPINHQLFKNRSFSNVWKEKPFSPTKRNHPHQKPLNLSKALIEATTEKGDLIVDPCAGGFGVLEVCLQTRRKFLGAEINHSEIEAYQEAKNQAKTCLICFKDLVRQGSFTKFF